MIAIPIKWLSTDDSSVDEVDVYSSPGLPAKNTDKIIAISACSCKGQVKMFMLIHASVELYR